MLVHPPTATSTDGGKGGNTAQAFNRKGDGMPGRQRAQTRPDDDVIDLYEAGERVNYSPQYLRKLWWTDERPPPLFKHRGRLVVHTGELDAWIAEREAS
jgi:hypothetical protein